ncbi:transcriptional regulator [Kitasatospora sp. MAP12-44]|uniref:transcriptional regulator n=1 Tax=unclassified Kitasatospora TaxID=2633591 RepID=UPI00247579D2|nr:transcriptional regulator [Kitasatospora sp. MAP12-44]MDH6107984.1 transcriptional regulator with XRE-family HTH domain [Kitasatospora sp. MAP12-44]
MGVFKHRLNHLFATVPSPAGRKFTNQEVADLTAAWAAESGDEGGSISASLIQKLRAGTKDNPTTSTVKALAAVFKVRASYFIDDEEPAAAPAESDSPVGRQDLERLIKDKAVQNLALRADGLSPETLSTLAGFIERARSLEGLDNNKESDG